MGRRRRNRTRKRSRRASQFAIRNMERMAEESERYEIHKDAHNDYCKEIADLERDHLERTVFVTHAKDLAVTQNEERLIQFFSGYGVVQRFELVRNKRRNVPPRARVTFADKSSVETILCVAKQNDNKIHNSVVGYKGFLVVLPATPNGGGGIQSDESNSRVEFQSLKLSFGHWISPGMILEKSGQIGIEDGSNEINGSSLLQDTSDGRGVFLEEASHGSGAQICFDFQRRTLTMETESTFTCETGINALLSLLSSSGKKSTLVIHWKKIVGSIEFCREEIGPNAGYSLIFGLTVPPQIFEKMALLDAMGGAYENDEERHTNFLDAPLARCFGFRVHVAEATARSLLEKKNISDRLRKFGVFSDRIYSLHEAVTVTTQGIEYDAYEAEIRDELGRIEDRKLALLVSAVLSGGKVCWYHALTDKSRTTEGSRSFFQLVRSEDPYLVERGLEQMLALQGPTPYPARVLSFCIEQNDEVPSNARISRIDSLPDYCMEVPRVLITPTRHVVVGYEIEMSNRVLRHFVENVNFEAEDFIRVTCGDEDGGMMFSDDMSKPICDRIRSFILNGLTINGRKYTFLAYSTSQLKERSFWMVSFPPSSRWSKNWSVVQIRDWMGDFSSIRSPSKYGARMGQCFSTTIQAGEAATRGLLSTAGLRVNDSLPDVTANGEGEVVWCHSDGTGVIDKETSLRVLQDVPFCPRDPGDISIIQIRCGGCKGTVSVWDTKDLKKRSKIRWTLSADIFLRESMNKFDAAYRHLEIVSIGTHVPYHLNRQMVMLLDVHGVPGSILVNLQRNMLYDLDRMMGSARDAFDVLPRLSGLNNTTKSSMMRMLRVGLSPREEPFLFSCLHAVRDHHLMNLRKKTRIHVEKGAVLMGGLDETGLLPEFCVFLQVRPGGMSGDWNSPDSQSPFKVITGSVLVAKHPVMHPGDLRMLYAVDIPALRGHTNVLLFSQQGMRPEANKMSGSDLDGDQFAITWDDRLFFQKWKALKKSCDVRHLGSKPDHNVISLLQQANRHPMMFDNATLPEEVEQVTDSHLADHFINHAKSDGLGQISMLWLDWASKLQQADCAQCLRLAELHSIAVDFPKSGLPAEIPRELRFGRFEPKAHWREKKNVKSYHCESTVGKLYDDVIAHVRQDENSSRIRRTCPAAASRQWNKKGQLLCFFRDRGEEPTQILEQIYKPVVAAKLGLYTDTPFGWKQLTADMGSYLHWALVTRKQYDDEVLSIMNRYKVHSEGELVTGCIKKFHKLNKRKQHDLSEEVRRQYQELRSTTRKAFFVEVLAYSLVDGADDEVLANAENRIVRNDLHFEGTEVARKLAAACYEVTYSPHFRGGSPPLQAQDGDELGLMYATDDNCALFSFPWVFADIITVGLDV